MKYIEYISDFKWYPDITFTALFKSHMTSERSFVNLLNM